MAHLGEGGVDLVACDARAEGAVVVATEELGTCEEHLALEEARDLITYEGGGHVSTGRWPRVNGEVSGGLSKEWR